MRPPSAVDLPALCDELLGPRTGSVRSPIWSCPSPTHAQTGATPPVSVFETRWGEQRWHCHGCGIGGSALDLVMTTHGVRIADAFDELARRTGHIDHPHRGLPSPRPARARRVTRARGPQVRDPEGLADYVAACARTLWQPAGAAVRDYLVDERGIPRSVLYANRIGADLGAHRQDRPDGVPNIRSPAALFPAIEGERPIFAQLRLLAPGERMPRYLNLASRLAENPKLALYRPAKPLARAVVVTEGPTDALAATAAGYRAAAVLGTGAARDHATISRRLARLGAPVVVAFDNDDAGHTAAQELLAALRDADLRATRLHLPVGVGDLNDWMRHHPDWRTTLEHAVRHGLTRGLPALQPTPPGL